MTDDGVVRGLDPPHNRLTISYGPKDDRRLTLPLAAQCDIVLNGQAKVQERLLKLADLKPGDKVSVAHDVAATRIDAHRVLGESGVIQRITERTIEVQHEGDGAATTYSIGPKCKITLGDEAVSLSELQAGDLAELTHDRPPDAKNPEALSVAAQRRPDNARWAIVLGAQDFDDRSLTPLEHAVADAKLVADALVKRYRVPADQALVLTDESLVRLEQAIPDRLAKIGAEAKLIVYVVGHAYLDDKGAVYLAPKNYDAKRPDVTGLALQWLVDQLEQCPAKEKLLLLDCCQEGEGADLRREPSSLEMIRALKGPPGRSPLRTLRRGGKLQARPTRPRRGGQAARPVRNERGRRIFRPRRRQSRRPRRNHRTVRVPPRGHGGGKRPKARPDARTRPPRRPTAPTQRRRPEVDSQVGRLSSANEGQFAGGQD